jgi:hypothetical protein
MHQKTLTVLSTLRPAFEDVETRNYPIGIELEKNLEVSGDLKTEMRGLSRLNESMRIEEELPDDEY